MLCQNFKLASLSTVLRNYRLFNPRLVTPKYFRYIFVSLCSENSLHPNPRLLSQNYNARENSHLLRNLDTRNARGTPEPKEPPQIGGGTFVTYPTFQTSASLSNGSPLLSHPPTHSYTEAAKPATKPHTLLRPPPSRSLFPDDVVHSNTSMSLIHRTG